MSIGIRSDSTRFPEVFSVDDLSTTAVEVGTDHVSVVWGAVIGGTADEVLQFQKTDGTVVHSIPIADGAYVALGPMGFREGLKIATADAAGDVFVMFGIATEE